jgi:hypothetical protein
LHCWRFPLQLRLSSVAAVLFVVAQSVVVHAQVRSNDDWFKKAADDIDVSVDGDLLMAEELSDDLDEFESDRAKKRRMTVLAKAKEEKMAAAAKAVAAAEAAKAGGGKGGKGGQQKEPAADAADGDGAGAGLNQKQRKALGKAAKRRGKTGGTTALQAQLKQMLAQPLVAKGVSRSFFTLNKTIPLASSSGSIDLTAVHRK